MTAAIHTFPLPDWFTAEQRTDAIVAAARAILRSPAKHSDEILHEACVAMMTWGTGSDYLEADIFAFAMKNRQRKAAHVAAKRRPSLASLAVVAGAGWAVAMIAIVFFKG